MSPAVCEATQMVRLRMALKCFSQIILIKKTIFQAMSTCFVTWIISLLWKILSNCVERLRARILYNKISFSGLFGCWRFWRKCNFSGQGSETGFKIRNFMGISHPVGTNIEQLFHLCKAVSKNYDKTAWFPSKILISQPSK